MDWPGQKLLIASASQTQQTANPSSSHPTTDAGSRSKRSLEQELGAPSRESGHSAPSHHIGGPWKGGAATPLAQPWSNRASRRVTGSEREGREAEADIARETVDVVQQVNGNANEGPRIMGLATEYCISSETRIRRTKRQRE
jgi:hypothetical protein